MDIMINTSLGFSILAMILYIFYYLKNFEFLKKISLYFLIFSWFVTLVYLVVFAFKLTRIPLSNQYESVLILGIFMFAINLYYYLKNNRKIEILIPSFFLSPLIFSILNILEPSFRPLMPALRSNWLFFHVITAMLSYSFFIIAGILGFVKLFEKDNENHYLLLKMTKIGFFMLTLGIITGAIWAESAWGRYWSWDPKETWSLITWFYYAFILHMFKKISKKNFYIMLFIGIFFIIFTYFGVNYLLGGLHSYV